MFHHARIAGKALTEYYCHDRWYNPKCLSGLLLTRLVAVNGKISIYCFACLHHISK